MLLTGSAPVSKLQDYGSEVTAYTRGEGRFSCVLGGYYPCAEAAEVIAASGYDSELDAANPTGSVFCAHGAGFYVPWNQVFSYMHLDSAPAAKEGRGPCGAGIRQAEPGVPGSCRSQGAGGNLCAHL